MLFQQFRRVSSARKFITLYSCPSALRHLADPRARRLANAAHAFPASELGAQPCALP